MHLQTVVFEILKAHGVLAEFHSLGNSREEIWSVEICPKEGICRFSRPLVVAKQMDIVRIGLMFHDVWEISFDPVIEFRVASSLADAAWEPIAVYRPHLGQKEVDTAQRGETLALAEELAATLIERGYEDINQGMIRRLHDQVSKPEISVGQAGSQIPHVPGEFGTTTLCPAPNAPFESQVGVKKGGEAASSLVGALVSGNEAYLNFEKSNDVLRTRVGKLGESQDEGLSSLIGLWEYPLSAGDIAEGHAAVGTVRGVMKESEARFTSEGVPKRSHPEVVVMKGLFTAFCLSEANWLFGWDAYSDGVDVARNGNDNPKLGEKENDAGELKISFED
ncbi:hypothetical protein HDU67_005162 [Dinochytrium kinnereticum]|nr:hypothetical protein HDU67_005162 [Dinochytrium kinnereticum]